MNACSYRNQTYASQFGDVMSVLSTNVRKVKMDAMPKSYLCMEGIGLFISVPTKTSFNFPTSTSIR